MLVAEAFQGARVAGSGPPPPAVLLAPGLVQGAAVAAAIEGTVVAPAPAVAHGAFVPGPDDDGGVAREAVPIVEVLPVAVAIFDRG